MNVFLFFRKGIALLFLCVSISSLYANIDAIPGEGANRVEGRFAKNKACVRCHLDIYEEFSQSAHARSSIVNDPIHEKIWQANPLSREGKYSCAYCHAPTVEGIDKVMNGEHKIGKKEKQQMAEGISCAMCHRINGIEPHPHGDRYVLDDKIKRYQGNRKPIEESEYHEIVRGNPIWQSGDLCKTCHTPHRKQKRIVNANDDSCFCIFSPATAEQERAAKNTTTENCVSCHMPQVPGSLSDRVSTETHASHRFAALHSTMPDAGKYFDVNLTKRDGGFVVSVTNRTHHDMAIHPTRLFVLSVSKNGKTLGKRRLYREKGYGDYPPLAWIDKPFNQPNAFPAGRKISMSFDEPLGDGDTVSVEMGYHLLQPSIGSRIGLKDKRYTGYRKLFSKTFRF